MLVNAAKHVALDALAAVATHVSLHSSYPGATGTGELAGGSPAYARKAAGWAAAASGAIDGGAATFDVPAATTVAWLGYWSAVSAGTYYGCAPLQGGSPGAPKPLASADDSTDVIVCEDHGFADTNAVVLWSTPEAGSSLPGGLVEGTVYYVRDATTDTFKLAATSGGAAIDVTDEGHGTVQRIVPETFASQGTFALTDHDLQL